MFLENHERRFGSPQYKVEVYESFLRTSILDGKMLIEEVPNEKKL